MKNKEPDEFCIKCGSKNIKMIRKGLEIDTFKCLDCKCKYIVSYPERW